MLETRVLCGKSKVVCGVRPEFTFLVLFHWKYNYVQYFQPKLLQLYKVSKMTQT